MSKPLQSGRPYHNPRYYEVAFGFVNPARQVDLYKRFMRKFSRISRTRRVLELGCGPGLILREFARRGYGAVGLDLSAEMLGYLGQRAKELHLRIETVRADMTSFRLRHRVDFAMMLMGTISHVTGHQQMRSHLASVAAALNRGGLYLIENCRIDWNEEHLNGSASWTMERNGIRVDATYSGRLLDRLTGRERETMVLRVLDHGRRRTLRESWETEIVFPREFEALVNGTRGLEFLGWFQRFGMRRLRRAEGDNIGLIRRT